MISDNEIDAFVDSLNEDEIDYARAFADFLALGSSRPDVPASIAVARAAEIRAQLSRAWARVVWRRQRSGRYS